MQGSISNARSILIEKSEKRRDHLEDLDVEGWIILKRIPGISM
jgi:hypothetical protein